MTSYAIYIEEGTTFCIIKADRDGVYRKIAECENKATAELILSGLVEAEMQ